MRILVITIVHHPLDARIFSRQITALLDAGHTVAYAAPWGAYGIAPPDTVRAIDLPRAAGRRRLRAIRQARRIIKGLARSADIILLHDPELMLAVAGLRRPPTVWDVHEDPRAALADKRWVPPAARPVLRAVIRLVEGIAERRLQLILAEEQYQERFRLKHPVVANDAWVPERVEPPGDDRVVYLGRISRGRGAETMLQLASLLPAGVTLELIGPCDSDVEPLVRAAQDNGAMRWHGFVPNDDALPMIDGALAGLSLLRDEPNYRHSRPTKVIEYLARGIPVITTPSPIASQIVRRVECGIVVDFDDAAAAARAVVRLRDDQRGRYSMAARGHAAARAEFDWRAHSAAFVRLIEELSETQQSARQ